MERGIVFFITPTVSLLLSRGLKNIFQNQVKEQRRQGRLEIVWREGGRKYDSSPNNPQRPTSCVVPFHYLSFFLFQVLCCTLAKHGYLGMDIMGQVNQKSEEQYSHSDDPSELSGKPTVIIIIPLNHSPRRRTKTGVNICIFSPGSERVKVALPPPTSLSQTAEHPSACRSLQFPRIPPSRQNPEAHDMVSSWASGGGSINHFSQESSLKIIQNYSSSPLAGFQFPYPILLHSQFFKIRAMTPGRRIS